MERGAHRSAAITAVGVVTAFGAGVDPLWEGLLSGETRVLPPPTDVPGEPAGPAARVPEPALGRVPAGGDRTCALLREAALQLTESPAWAGVRGESLGVCVGTTQGPIQTWTREQRRLADASTPVGPPPSPPSLAGPVRGLARFLGAGGPVWCPSMACASGTAAIGIGLDWIRAGACDAVVAGGVDILSGFVQAGFAALKALDPRCPRPFDRDRAGLGLGEGAALVLLQRDGHPGASRLTGAAQSADAVHLTGPDASGSGLARAIRGAIRDASLDPDQIDFVNAHGTATVYNDLMESKALRLVFGDRTSDLPVNSIKGAIGHTMAAAGAIEAVLCTLVLEHGQIPPTANLSLIDPEIPLNVVRGDPIAAPLVRVLTNSSGFGGINAALVIERS